MIDPENVTNYNLDDRGIEENALFWLLVAGKTADVVAVALEHIIAELSAATGSDGTPFELVRTFLARKKRLRPLLKRHGIGCHGAKARGVTELVRSNLDLRTCTLADLTAIHSVGLKTAQCFLLHTRKNSNVVGLDTHMLAELRERGHPAPKVTPSSLAVYERWADVVRAIAREEGMSLPEFDLHIFNKRHRKVFREEASNELAAPAASELRRKRRRTK